MNECIVTQSIKNFTDLAAPNNEYNYVDPKTNKVIK